MPQEQLLDARPPDVVNSILPMADLSFGAGKVVRMASLCNNQPTALFANNQTVVVYFAEVPEQLSDIQTLVSKSDYFRVIENVVGNEAESVWDHGPPCASSKSLHQLETFVLSMMKADLYPC